MTQLHIDLVALLQDRGIDRDDVNCRLLADGNDMIAMLGQYEHTYLTYLRADSAVSRPRRRLPALFHANAWHRVVHGTTHLELSELDPGTFFK